MTTNIFKSKNVKHDVNCYEYKYEYKDSKGNTKVKTIKREYKPKSKINFEIYTDEEREFIENGLNLLKKDFKKKFNKELKL